MAVSLPDHLDPRALLRLLADGGTHSLARLPGADSGAVERLVGELRDAGVAIDAVAGQDYRLPAPVELLDPERIRGAMREELRARVHRLEVPFAVDSTSTRLAALPPPPRGTVNVCAAYRHRGQADHG